MPFTSDDDHPPPRNARSFDLDDSATKAAAWVWHLHELKPGVTTEGRFLSSQSRRRSSSSSDRKISRFRHEAAEFKRTEGGNMEIDVPMWDCGSNLYDTFELVTFGNRLDRSLMEAVPLTPPPPPPQASVIPHEHHMSSPLHEPGGVLRTRSLPKSTQACRQTSKKKHVQNRAATDANRVSLAKSRELSFSVFYQHQVPKRWPSVEKLMKALKKVVDLHKQVSISVGCKHTINIVEPASQRPLEPSIVSTEDRDNKQLLAANSKGRVSSSHECVGDDNLPSMQRSMKTRRKSTDEELLSGRRTKGSISEGTNHHLVKEWSKPRISSQNCDKHLHHHHHHHHHHYLHHTLASESARLSPQTLSQICAEKGWLT